MEEVSEKQQDERPKDFSSRDINKPHFGAISVAITFIIFLTVVAVTGVILDFW